MKNKGVLILSLIIICLLCAQCVNVLIKYDVNVFEFIKYSMPVSEEEREYLDNNKLKFNMETDFAPISYADPNTEQLLGLVHDYISQISIVLEKDIKLIPMDEDFETEDISTLDNNSITYAYKTNVNYYDYNFTQTLYVLHGKILVNNDSKFIVLEDVNNAKLAVVKDDSIIGYAKNFYANHENVEFVMTEDLYESIKLLDSGQVDGIVADETQISYIVNQVKLQNNFRFLKHALYRKELCFLVADDNQILVDILNKGILEIKKNNTISQVQNKWFATFKPDVKDMNEYSNIYYTFFFVATVVAALLAWNLFIRAKVEEQTREIRKGKEELREIIDTLSDGIFVIDDNDKILECNHYATLLCKMEREEIIGKYIYDLAPSKDFFTDLVDEKTLISGNKYFRVTKQNYKRDIKQSLIMVSDITEKHINELRTRQESKMIAVGQLMAGLAHEIRNPLGLIKSYSFVLNKYCENDLEKHALGVINSSVGRINGFIENLLNFSRLTNDEKQVTTIKTLIDEIIELENKTFKQKGIEIALKYNEGSEDNIIVNTDIIKLSLLNLLNNGIEAFESGDIDKNIIISSKIEDNILYLNVTDNGCGIAPENLEHVFNPFYTTKSFGNGLGLYIVSSELAKINGKINVKSEAGSGTSFELTIPVDRA
ncbi:MAG: ATP-binding protein [Anaerovoracaceae bacterium]